MSFLEQAAVLHSQCEIDLRDRNNTFQVMDIKSVVISVRITIPIKDGINSKVPDFLACHEVTRIFQLIPVSMSSLINTYISWNVLTTC